jgi:outer membrane protein
MRIIFSLVVLIAAISFPAKSQQSAVKVGYADINYIMSQMPEAKDIEAELTNTENQLKAQLDAKQQKLQKQYSDYITNRESMPDTAIVKAEEEFEVTRADLEQFRSNAQSTLENKQKLLMAPLYLKVSRAISEVAKENGFSMIITNRINRMDFMIFKDEKLTQSFCDIHPTFH